MNHINLSEYYYLSKLESENVTNLINKWREICNLNDNNQNTNLIKSIIYDTNDINKKYKYIITSKYRGQYYNISEIILLLLNIWKSNFLFNKKKEEFETCIQDDITSYAIYYQQISHSYQILFLFY